jgi:MYXO-CTERM domain-containing protein
MRISMLALGVALCFGCAAVAAPITYITTLNGATEGTPSPGTGTGLAIIDLTANTLFVSETFSGLLSPTTASHIHCCTAAPLTGTAGVATQVPSFTMFPSGVTSGTFSQTLDLTQAASWNGAFITSHGGTTASAEAALVAGLAAGEAYFNIHTNQFPGGEIEGFLTAQTPEPGTIGLALLGVAGLLAWRRKHQVR